LKLAAELQHDAQQYCQVGTTLPVCGLLSHGFRLNPLFDQVPALTTENAAHFLYAATPTQQSSQQQDYTLLHVYNIMISIYNHGGVRKTCVMSIATWV
jgi:hypothetical protein